MGLFDRSKSTSTNTTNNLSEYYTETYNSALAGGDSAVGDGANVLQHSNLSTIDNSLAYSMSDNSMTDASRRVANSNNVDSSDNSFTNLMTDNSNRSSSTRNSATYSDTSNRSFNDSSSADNSFTTSMADSSNRSNNYSSSDSSVHDYSMRDSSNRSFNDSSSADNSLHNSMTDNSDRSSSDSSNRSTNITQTDGGSFGMVSDIMKNVIGAFSTNNSKMLDFVGLNQKESLGTTNALVGRSLDSAMAIKSGSVISEPASQNTAKMVEGGVKIAALAAAAFAAYKIFGGRK